MLISLLQFESDPERNRPPNKISGKLHLPKTCRPGLGRRQEEPGRGTQAQRSEKLFDLAFVSFKFEFVKLFDQKLILEIRGRFICR